ncbi:MAG: Carboxy-terminal domain (CTD) phosphatase [Vezdaea aestivalis]|nr:MAG: Carboxy-terminal domain (CTD) phosphatase [Vezdaea aestivalis]
MQLRLARSLHFPITIIELYKQPDDRVTRQDALFRYSYRTKVTESGKYGEETVVEKEFPTEFHSPVDGVFNKWMITKGAVIESSNVLIAEIEEPCSHAVQFGGLCTICGKDMTEITYNTEQVDAERATINMIHDNNSLRVSQDEASRVEEEVKRRLLKSKKLSLVVDLDQTIIHATVDPTIAEWKDDPQNPNYSAVKDVRQFQLIDEGAGNRGCWYYIKLRPGLQGFLENISRIYELHVYTMGTRAYALNIAKIVDPERKIFGDRILSRDESGSLTAKNLQRIFPVDTKMVAIIDDRADVWSWSDNLVKVTPYDFFVGIGDINSSFLPKKPELNTKTKVQALTKDTPPDEATSIDESKDKIESSSTDTNGIGSQPDSAKSELSPLEQIVTMGGGDNPVVLELQASKQDEEIASQLEERPLLKKQKELEAEDEAAAAAAAAESSPDSDKPNPNSDSDEPSSDSGKQRHRLLVDDDAELEFLEKGLTEVHTAFFEEYERRLARVQGGRVAALRGHKHAKKVAVKDGADLEIVPDIKIIMPLLKSQVLYGAVLVFTGVVPIGYDVQTSDIALHAKSFGAEVSDTVSRSTTHCIAGRPRTNKVRQAAKHPAIHIVSVAWLTDSISRWERQPEDPYQLPIHPEDRLPDSQSSPWTWGPAHEGLSDSSDMDEDEKDDTNGTGKVGAGLGLNTDIDLDDPDLIPPDMGDISPIQNFDGFNWGSVDDELAEFLGSDADDDSSMGGASELEDEAEATDEERPNGGESDGTQNLKKRKRISPASSTGSISSVAKPSDDESVTDDGFGAINGGSKGSRLSKRKSLASGRATKLKKVEALPKSNQAGNARFDDEEDDGELERELELEMMGAQAPRGEDEGD